MPFDQAGQSLDEFDDEEYDDDDDEEEDGDDDETRLSRAKGFNGSAGNGKDDDDDDDDKRECDSDSMSNICVEQSRKNVKRKTITDFRLFGCRQLMDGQIA